MWQYLTSDYDGPPFDLFGSGHLLALAIILAVIAFLIWGWKTHDEESRRRVRLWFAGTIFVVEISWHVWHLANGSWTLERHLPLHTCSLGLWGSIYMLLTRSYRFYEIFFFLGIAGGVQALITPNAGEFGLPHFRAMQTLASHGLLVIAMVYMTAIEGYRPTWQSIVRTMVFANLYMLCVTGVNVLVGGNYMYTLRKPETASLLDLLGPWPWYLFYAEFVALALFILLYLPFALNDWRLRSVSVTR
jgi:hypothetical integral membrane protein (TIGR02206 family)